MILLSILMGLDYKTASFGWLESIVWCMGPKFEIVLVSALPTLFWCMGVWNFGKQTTFLLLLLFFFGFVLFFHLFMSFFDIFFSLSFDKFPSNHVGNCIKGTKFMKIVFTETVG